MRVSSDEPVNTRHSSIQIIISSKFGKAHTVVVYVIDLLKTINQLMFGFYLFIEMHIHTDIQCEHGHTHAPLDPLDMLTNRSENELLFSGCC